MYKRMISLLLAASLLLSASPLVYASEEPDAEEALIAELEKREETEAPAPEVEAEEPETQPEVLSSEEEEPAQPEEADEAKQVEAAEPEAEEPVVPGMPERYVLSADELAAKAALAEHDVPGTLAKLTAGKDYVADQVILLAETEDYASMAAAAYGGTLTRYVGTVATITLAGLSVPEAVALAADPDTILPAVEPNYLIRRTSSPSAAPFAPEASAQAISVPEEETWYTWTQELMTNPDSALVESYWEEAQGFGEYQMHHDILHSYAAWGISTGKPDIVVGLISSGVDNRSGEILNLIQPDVLDYGAYSEYNVDGTISAHLIAGAMNNGQYGAGIAPNVTIRSYNSFLGYSQSVGDVVYLVQCATWAGVDIIYTDLYASYFIASYETAVKNALNAGITVIAPATSYNAVDTPYCPANVPGVIGVAPTDFANYRSAGFGPHVDVCAPGENTLYWESPDGYYCSMADSQVAAALVTGAAALYMSKVGHVSPAEMEKVLKASCNKSPSSGMGAGVIDLAKMFRGETSAPEINLYDYFGVSEHSAAVMDDSGMVGPSIITPGHAVVNSDPVKTISADGYITITQPKSNDALLIYTTDGKNPSVKNGEVVNGIRYSEPIPASKLGTGKITLKAASISGLGVLSKTSSIKLNIVPGSIVSDITITAPAAMNAGTSVTLTAAVAPSTANQTVYWSIQSNTCGAKLDMKTGKLTTVAGITGSVTVRASAAADTSVYKDVRITVQNAVPVTSVTLNEKTLSLRSYTNRMLQALSTPVQLIPTFRGSTGILSGVSYSFTSSNTKVVSVSSDGKLTPVAPGTASITCKALDGSNKSAVCKVTVQAGLEDASISGQTSIAPGASAAYKLSTNPAKVKAQSIYWSLRNAPDGVTVDPKKGTVKVAPYVPIYTSFTLSAKIFDGTFTQTCSYTVRIQNKANKITIRQDWDSYFTSVYTADAKNNNNLKNATISSTPMSEQRLSDGSVINSNKLQLRATLHGVGVNTDAANLTWTSSNPKVAEIDQNGLVTAKAAGKVKITCKANDGSNKSASFSLTVETPPSSTDVTNPDGISTITYGKSVNNIPVFGTKYGTPSNKAVTWSLRFYEYWNDENGEYYENNYTRQAELDKTVTISAKGKLTVKPGAAKYKTRSDSTLRVEVYAHSASEFFNGSFSSIGYDIRPAATKLTMEANTISLAPETNQYFNLYVEGSGIADDYLQFQAVSSNPDIASSASIYKQDDGVYRVLVNAGRKTGTAKITITTKDTAKTKIVLTVKVK